jgi:hypothetical protein
MKLTGAMTTAVNTGSVFAITTMPPLMSGAIFMSKQWRHAVEKFAKSTTVHALTARQAGAISTTAG